jgi:hypothetical protein
VQPGPVTKIEFSFLNANLMVPAVQPTILIHVGRRLGDRSARFCNTA